MPETSPRTAYSRISVESRTVLPADVRERLAVGPGDRLRYRITPDGIQAAVANHFEGVRAGCRGRHL